MERILSITASIAALLVGACSTSMNEGGSETNWVACDESNPCSAGYSCREELCVPAPEDSGTATSTRVLVDLLTTTEEEPGRCLPTPLETVDGLASCSMIEATQGACSCEGRGRMAVAEPDRSLALGALRRSGVCDQPGGPSCSDACLCLLPQLAGSDLVACQQEAEPSVATEGWCYVEPDAGVGAPALVADCPESDRQRLRVLAPSAAESKVALLCTFTSEVTPVAGSASELGEPCVPGDQGSATFPGYSFSEISIYTGGAQCGEGGTCLVAHFEGRLGCPYGQQAGEGACMTSGPDPVPVTVAVEPQLVARAPDDSVYCSCRCAGPGTGPFCTCPSGFTCEPVFPTSEGPGPEDIAGSYCVKTGTIPEDPATMNTAPCNSSLASCDGR